MSRFFYEAVDGQGRRVPGVLDCEDESRLARILEDKGQTLIQCGLRPLVDTRTRERRLKGGVVGAGERSAFAVQMARLTESGCPMDRALDLVCGIAQTRKMESTLRQARADVQQGASLNEALARHPDVFHALFLATVKAGESGGFLSKAFAKLGEFEKKQDRLQKKVVGSLIYPSFMVVMVLVCVAVVMIFVVPALTDFFKTSNMALPMPTVVLIWVSNNAIELFGGLFGALAVGVTLFVRLKDRPAVRARLDRLSITLPVLGGVTRTLMLERFCRILALLLDGGVSLTRALAITRDAVTNSVFQREIELVGLQVTEGEAMSRCLEVSPLFPEMLAGQVRFGEETGTLAKALASLAEEYELQATTAMDTVVGLIEPMIIVFMGLVMGAIVIAVFMPMVTMINVQ